MIRIARPLYADEDLGLELDNTVYVLDASTIDLCLSVFPWALFRSTKSAIKLHTLLDLRGNIPTFIYVSDGKMHDVNVLGILVPELGEFYIMDRGYVDFERLFLLLQRLPSQSYTATDGKSSCSSSGSSNIYASSHSLAHRRTRSRVRYGLR